MTKRSVHAVPRGKGWAIKKSGASRVSSNHRTQEAAWAAARKVAKKESSEAYKHGADGRIKDRSSFGKDPFPPRG